MGTKHGKKKNNFPRLSILVIGNFTSGRTALINCYEYIIKTNKEYDEKNNQPLDLDTQRKINTTPREFITLDHTIKGENNEDINIKVKIWDSIGSERFYYYVGAIKCYNGIILTYDITSRESFEALNQWINRIKDGQDISIFPIVIVGCKFDLEDKRKVSTEEGKKFAEKYNLTFFETSALTGKGVKEAFSTLIQKAYEIKIKSIH